MILRGLISVRVSIYSKGTSSFLQRFRPKNSLNRHSFFSTATETSLSLSSLIPVERIRNIAIIAHVDHGKTTLVDCLLRQSSATTEEAAVERLMDCNTLEKERGITILAKCTSINLAREENSLLPYRINIVDTPGHADFGGEVERVLGMVDGVVLLVDATEGPMAQTKFVLGKALGRGLKPIVVFNKIDRPSSRPDEVDSELLDLFVALGANERQLEYKTVYASAKEGWASLENPLISANNVERNSMKPLFDMILSEIPHPKMNRQDVFRLLVNNIEANAFLGRCFLGLVHSGVIKVGDPIKSLNDQGEICDSGRVTKMFLKRGLQSISVEEAGAGEIISIAGISNATINSTLCSPENEKALQGIPVDPPTLSIMFTINDSPLAGKEGKSVTSQILGARLMKEAETNVAMQVSSSPENPDSFEVRGRGELQLGILIETMRREGLEFSVSPPRVLTKKIDKKTLEPVEEVTIDCETQYSGSVIEKLSKRKAELQHMVDNANDKVRLVFKAPSRGLIGYSAEFKNDTHGTGVLNHVFLSYEEWKGDIEVSRKGSLISMSDGPATPYALVDLEARGVLFVAPNTKVYTGMVVGECSRNVDMEVNPVRAKHLSNVRTAGKDDFVRLVPPKIMNLEEMLAYMNDDEMIEVTPTSVRLRKRYLDANTRKLMAKKRPVVN